MLKNTNKEFQIGLATENCINLTGYTASGILLSLNDKVILINNENANFHKLNL